MATTRHGYMQAVADVNLLVLYFSVSLGLTEMLRLSCKKMAEGLSRILRITGPSTSDIMSEKLRQ